MFVCSANSIRQAIRQIERWIYASEQDADPRIQILHANYAVGNIDMLRQMVTDNKIRQATGKDILELWMRATKAQDAAQKYFME